MRLSTPVRNEGASLLLLHIQSIVDTLAVTYKDLACSRLMFKGAVQDESGAELRNFNLAKRAA
jgi:hypothetical protein